MTETVYVEHEGALYRGKEHQWPKEVYSSREKTWLPYTGFTPKPLTWGEIVSEEEANDYIREDATR